MALTLEQFAKQKGVKLPSERLGIELPSKPVGLDVFLKQRIGLKELPKERKIARLQAEAEQAMKRAEYLSSPVGLAKQTIKEIPAAVRKIVSRKGLLSPKGIQAAVEGAFRTAVISPVSAVTRFATKGKLDIEKGWAELTEPWRKTLTPAQKEIERGFAMGGLVVPYGAAEAAALKGISYLGKLEKVKPVATFLLNRPKLLKAGKVGVNMASFIGTGQILHKPEDGSRAKQAMIDAALAVAFPVIGYAVRKPLKAGLKLAMKRVEKVFEPIIEKIKLKKPVPLEEIERAVDQSKKVIKRTTGKSPEQVLKKEVLPKAIADSAKKGEIPKGKAVAELEKTIAKGKRPTDKQLDAAIKELERKIKIRVKEEAPELPVEAISKPKKPAEAKIEGIPKEEKERMWLLVVEDRYIPTIFKERKKLQEIYLRGLREIRKYFPDAKIGYTKSSVLSPAARKILHLVTGEPEVLIEAQPKIFFKVKNHLFSIGQSGDWPLCRETSSGAVRIVKTKRYPYLAEIIEIKRRGHHAVSWDYKAKVSSWIRDLEKSDIEKLLKVKEIANKLGTDAALNIGGIETIPFPTEFLGIYKKLLQSPKGGVREIKVGEIKKISPPKIKPSEVKSLQVSEIPVVSKRKIPSGISEKAFRWIDFFFFGSKAEREKAFKLLTPEIKKEISKFKPNKPVRLYKYPGESELPQGFTYWTHDKEFAQRLSGPGEFVSKVIKPKDILVDFTETPSNFPGEKGGIWGKGVIVKPSAVKGVKVAVKGVKEAKPILKETWQKISTYPKKGDYVRVNWKGKTFEGKITGEKPVRFRTGYVAREITTKEGVKKWMPWTSSAKYEVKVEKPAKTKPVIKVEKPTPEIKPKRIKVPSEQLPVGEGKELASRLEKRIVERLSKAPERYKTVTYKQMNKAEQIKKAVDYVVKNESEAMEVLMGKKEPPKGLLYNSIFLAMEEKAKQDTALAVRLASLRATRSGQEISILTEADKNNPVRFLSEIQRDRVKIIGGREKVVKYTKSLVKQGKKILSKNYLKVDEWENFIKSIQC